MPIVLELLDGVRWQGTPVVGDRPQALLAALASDGGRTVPLERLVTAVWGDDVPANTGKALQVLVSRTRASCGAGAVLRDDHGYRLGLPAEQVDALRLDELRLRARRALAGGDPVGAREAVAEAVELVPALTTPDDGVPGALADVRRRAATQRTELHALLGRALSATGEHADALPLLEDAYRADRSDEAVLACLLRSESTVRGAGAALDRYEDYRKELRDRLGVDPGERLRRVHGELLALDNPVRDGLRYDATSLLGRDEDVQRLRALVESARVVSIVGPGGLGKTRLAHVLGRDAVRPVVHFVELVGVTAPEDLIGEIGSALGVRDSVSGRRALTPEQRADVRTRIARHLATAPSLLILDNCEHLVDAVADLVAFLVATTSELTVVTTTRAPLAIGAERVYQLTELDPANAVELFRQRAVAARPSVRLDAEVVTDIVTRLDGLPLAIELAAAKVRVMSVEDVRRRLADRFALLRGGVRNAPDRHQTLLAVIDWSWHLLGEPERRALRLLSVFHDGFTLETAEAMLGDDALAAVHALVDQSLLSVGETGTGVRYRMLETVREFGRMHLVEAGEEDAAFAARRDWATRFATYWGGRTFSRDQFAAMDALDAEESNLSDTLRHALTTSDPATVVRVLCGLGPFWSIRGEHNRVVSLLHATTEVLAGWQPPAELRDAVRATLAILVQNALISSDTSLDTIREMLAELGPGQHGDPRMRALVTVMLDLDPHDQRGTRQLLSAAREGADRHLANVALQWRSHELENSGDLWGAIDAAERALALTRESDGPWAVAFLRTQLSQLHCQLGNHDVATPHTLAAIPVLRRLRAFDDVVQLESSLVLAAIAAGRLDEAQAQLDRVHRSAEDADVVGGAISLRLVAAELAFARGDARAGLDAYRVSVVRMRTVPAGARPSTGLEPWVLLGESTTLTAFALHGDTADDAEGAQLFDHCRRLAPRALDPTHPYVDYPVTGMLLFALGTWSLTRQVLPAADAVTLLVLAERFAYNQMMPTMAWGNVAPVAERQAPGRIAELREEYGDRRGPDLLDEARRMVERLA